MSKASSRPLTAILEVHFGTNDGASVSLPAHLLQTVLYALADEERMGLWLEKPGSTEKIARSYPIGTQWQHSIGVVEVIDIDLRTKHHELWSVHFRVRGGPLAGAELCIHPDSLPTVVSALNAPVTESRSEPLRMVGAQAEGKFHEGTRWKSALGAVEIMQLKQAADANRIQAVMQVRGGRHHRTIVSLPAEYLSEALEDLPAVPDYARPGGNPEFSRGDNEIRHVI
jgi:hypothetical protein